MQTPIAGMLLYETIKLHLKAKDVQRCREILRDVQKCEEMPPRYTEMLSPSPLQ